MRTHTVENLALVPVIYVVYSLVTPDTLELVVYKNLAYMMYVVNSLVTQETI